MPTYVYVLEGTLSVHAHGGEAREYKAKNQDELAFEWRLTRGADTSAWSIGDDYSVVAVRLDVQPVRLARPLYTPWR